METANFKAQEIQISSVFFRQNGDQIRFESYPRRIMYKGRQYALIDN
jgi:hypothetical protein